MINETHLYNEKNTTEFSLTIRPLNGDVIIHDVCLYYDNNVVDFESAQNDVPILSPPKRLKKDKYAMTYYLTKFNDTILTHGFGYGLGGYKLKPRMISNVEPGFYKDDIYYKSSLEITIAVRASLIESSLPFVIDMFPPKLCTVTKQISWPVYVYDLKSKNFIKEGHQ